MDTLTRCLLVVGGPSGALGPSLNVPPGPSPLDDSPDSVAVSTEGELPPETTDSAEASNDGWLFGFYLNRSSSIRLYFRFTWGPPVRWLRAASARHPELRYALLWTSDGIDACGVAWAESGELPPSFDIEEQQNSERVAGDRSGWVRWFTDGVGWVAQRCPPDAGIDSSAFDEFIEPYLVVAVNPQMPSAYADDTAS